MKINIAIDGPSAAGKSTIAKLLAKKLGYAHLDTGAMYRCVGYHADRIHVSLDDEDALAAMTAAMQIRFDSEGRVFLNGEDVSSAIREIRVSLLASRISVYPRVRQLLVDMQRQMAAEKGIIMDGRDIGTVVLPDAELKIFMVASVEARARRRYQEYVDKHIEADYQRICEDIQKRDDQDMHRAASPLRKAADAHEIDTSDMSIPEVCDAIMKLAEKTIV